MAEEQIDKLTIEVEAVDPELRGLEEARRLLGRLEKIDLSDTIRQVSNLRAALMGLSGVDASVKTMLSDLAKLGLRASEVNTLGQALKHVGRQASQTREEIAQVVDAALKAGQSPAVGVKSGKKESGHEIPSSKYRSYDGAEEEIKRVTRALYGMGEAGEKAGKKNKRSLKETGEAAREARKHTSKLGDAFARIVRFKLVAGVMQKVINSAKAGIEALREFDDGFRDTLRSYSAAEKSVGATAASTISPALEALEPVVSFLADGVADMHNTISAIIAMISSEDEFRAVKSVEQLKKELAASEENARELRHLISGFDELNLFRSGKSEDKTSVNPFETRPIDGYAFTEDAAGAAEFALVAGTVALAVKELIDLFGGKNKLLRDQTERTKADADATEELGKTANAIIPGLAGLGELLFGLGKQHAQPRLEPGGVTLPAGEAAGAANELGGALDAVGEKKPAPSIDPDGLLVGLDGARGEIEAFIAYPFAPVPIDADNSGVPVVLDDTKRRYSDLLGGMQTMTQKSCEAVRLTFAQSFDSILASWDGLLGQMKSRAGTAFDEILDEWRDMVKQLGGTPVANVTPYEVFKASQTPGVISSGAARLEQNKMLGLYAPPSKAPSSDWTPSSESEGWNSFMKEVKKSDPAWKDMLDLFGNAALDLGPLLTAITGRFAGIGIPGFARGGMVTAGEFFLARENGIPEYVGSFGSQTAVANNEQITSGISAAVERVLAAYIPQVISAIEENAAQVAIGDDEIARAAARGASKYARTTGRPLFS